MKQTLPITLIILILCIHFSQGQQPRETKQFAWERYFVLQTPRTNSTGFTKEGIEASLGVQRIPMENFLSEERERVLSISIQTLPDPLSAGLEDYYKESSAFIVDAWVEKALDFMQREKDFVGGYKNGTLLYAVAHIFDAFLIEQSNVLVEDDGLSRLSLGEQYAFTVFDKAVLQLGEDIMFDVLDKSFDSDVSFFNIVHTLYRQPQKSLVLLGIAGGFAGYLGLQYVSKDYIVFPPITIDFSERVSMDIDVIYVGKGFKSNNLHQLPGSERNGSRRNPVPCMVSLNVAL